MTIYTLDGSTRRPPGSEVVIGGSPLRVFRLTAAGSRAYERIAAGEDIEPGSGMDRLVDRLLDAGAIHPHPTTSPYTAADVTVVVPALVLGDSSLIEIVRSCPGVAAVIAVDDASDPPVHAVAGARVLRLRTNAGPAVARNAGLGATSTPLIAFVDTDVRLEPGWIDRLLPHFTDDRVGLVAPRVASAPGAGPLAGYEQGHSPLDLGPQPGRIAPGTRLSYVPAAALVVRTDALRAIGGFDRQLRLGEDVDAVWRLVEAGWRCRYEPAAVVHHRPRSSWRGLVAQRIAYGSSAAALAKRHRGALAPVRMSGWSAGAWGLAAAGHPAAGLAVAAGTAAALVRKLPGVPARESMRLAGLGHLYAGRLLADAARRTWWPLLVGGAVVSPRVRRLAALSVVPALLGGGLPRLVDDLAYGAGVWKGVFAEREPGPITPRFTSWPGRTPAADAR
ncbi:MAG: mycofactocin biosynthesis glycosyltransferase MftF [Ilumatobacteraceae bacterium]